MGFNWVFVLSFNDRLFFLFPKVVCDKFLDFLVKNNRLDRDLSFSTLYKFSLLFDFLPPSPLFTKNILLFLASLLNSDRSIFYYIYSP